MDSSKPPLSVICLNTDVHVRTPSAPRPPKPSLQLHPPSSRMIESIGNRGAWREEEQVLLSTSRATTAFSHLKSGPPSIAADLPPPHFHITLVLLYRSAFPLTDTSPKRPSPALYAVCVLYVRTWPSGPPHCSPILTCSSGADRVHFSSSSRSGSRFRYLLGLWCMYRWNQNTVRFVPGERPPCKAL